MLAYFLATIMAIISLLLFLNAFISPKTHRQDDFLWSGLGLFYALILWICASRFTGAILLGQFAGVAITIAFMWENRQLRKVITAESDSNKVLEGFSVLSFIAQSIAKVSSGKKSPKIPSSKPSTPEKAPEVKESEASTSDASKDVVTPEETTETVAPEEPTKEEETSSAEIEDVTANVEVEETEVSDDHLETTSEPEEELLGSSLATETETKEVKQNIFTRILGIFRKPKSETVSPDDSETEMEEAQSTEETLAEIEALEDDIKEFEEFEKEEIDLKTTATEVEQAIDNLELSDNILESDLEDQTEKQDETIAVKQIIEEINDSDMETITPVEVVEETVDVMEEEAIQEEEQQEDKLINSDSNVEETEASESSEPETPDEDDIIESLSDLFPQPEERESELESSANEEESDEEIDALANLFEDKNDDKSDSN
jgi:hypothetical protein